MKKNGFAPLIIILVIAILGVVGYFGYKDYLSRPQPVNVVSPSLSTISDPTINWKIYSNSDVGFSFKYPNSFIEKPIGTIYKNEEVKLFVGDNQYSLLLRLSSDSKAYDTKNLKEFSNSTKSIGSYTAYLTSSVASGGEFSTTAVIPFGKYFIDISINPNGGGESKATATEEIRDQILSTLKLTK